MSDIQSFPSSGKHPAINWPEQFKSWKKSGLSKAEYCRQKKIRYSSFLYWRKKYESPQSPPSGLSFVRLDNTVLNNPISLTNIVDSPTDISSGIRIFLNPLSISVDTNFSPSTLSQVIQILWRI